MSVARKQPPNGSRLQVLEETLYPYRDVQLVNRSIGFNQRLRIVEPLPLTSRAAAADLAHRGGEAELDARKAR